VAAGCADVRETSAFVDTGSVTAVNWVGGWVAAEWRVGKEPAPPPLPSAAAAEQTTSSLCAGRTAQRGCYTHTHTHTRAHVASHTPASRACTSPAQQIALDGHSHKVAGVTSLSTVSALCGPAAAGELRSRLASKLAGRVKNVLDGKIFGYPEYDERM
jgi:hypothetical protein